jgi:hypothetical protein
MKSASVTSKPALSKYCRWLGNSFWSNKCGLILHQVFKFAAQHLHDRIATVLQDFMREMETEFFPILDGNAFLYVDFFFSVSENRAPLNRMSSSINSAKAPMVPYSRLRGF